MLRENVKDCTDRRDLAVTAGKPLDASLVREALLSVDCDTSDWTKER